MTMTFEWIPIFWVGREDVNERAAAVKRAEKRGLLLLMRGLGFL